MQKAEPQDDLFVFRVLHGMAWQYWRFDCEMGIIVAPLTERSRMLSALLHCRMPPPSLGSGTARALCGRWGFGTQSMVPPWQFYPQKLQRAHWTRCCSLNSCYVQVHAKMISNCIRGAGVEVASKRAAEKSICIICVWLQTKHLPFSGAGASRKAFGGAETERMGLCGGEPRALRGRTQRDCGSGTGEWDQHDHGDQHAGNAGWAHWPIREAKAEGASQRLVARGSRPVRISADCMFLRPAFETLCHLHLQHQQQENPSDRVHPSDRRTYASLNRSVFG